VKFGVSMWSPLCARVLTAAKSGRQAQLGPISRVVELLKGLAEQAEEE